METELVVRQDTEPGVRVLALNRPERLNAITTDLIEVLHGRLDDVETDPEIRVVILTGAGRGFCAGADLMGGWDEAPSETNFTPADRSYLGQRRISQLVARIHSIPKVFIAAVNGPAAGGGFALALACDIRLGSTTAKFLVANVKIGLSAGEMGISYLLPRIIGGGHATDLMLTGRTVHADEALALGLISQVHEPDALLDAASDRARLVLSNPAFGVELSKEMLAAGRDAPSLDYAILLENRTQVLAGYSGDIAKAIENFRTR